MKKRRLKPIRLMRYGDGIMPAVWLIASFFAPEEKMLAFFAWFGVRMFALFTADGLRMAYATQPGMREVRGSTTGALLMQIIGAIAMSAAFQIKSPDMLALIGIGLLLNIEHVFYEYLHAAGDRYSAILCRILTATFMAAWLFMKLDVWAGLGVSVLSALLALIIAITIGDWRPAALNVGIFKALLRALIYGALYPAAVLMLCHIMSWDFDVRAFLTGCLLLELCRTPFRRSWLESTGMNRALFAAALLSAAGIFCAVYFDFERYIVFPASFALAAICAFALWGGIRLKSKD